MLMRSDPFRELDRLAQDMLTTVGTRLRPVMMPMDAYRTDDKVVVHFDLPGIDPESVDLTVERNVLTISGQRTWEPAEDVEVLVAERPHGTFSRQLFLGEGLDTEHVEARYADGVLTVTVPLVEQAKPRKVEITAGDGGAKAIETTTSSR